MFLEQSVHLDKPYMLMFDIGNSTSTPEVLAYVRKAAKVGPSCFYGTSGCGNTKSIQECLCQDYGIYFVSEASDWNPGSFDMKFIVGAIEKNLGENLRFATAEKHLETMLYSRLVVFRRVSEFLEASHQNMGGC